MKLAGLLTLIYGVLLAVPAVHADDQMSDALPPVAPPIESLDSALRKLQEPSYAPPASADTPATTRGAQETNAPTAGASAAPVSSVATPPATASTSLAAAQASSSLPFPMLYVYEFSAGWCPSCKKLSPMVEKTAEKYKDFIQFIPVNIDKNEELVRKLNVMQIPTVMVVDRSGRMLNRLIGLQQGQQIDVILDHYKQKALATVSTPQ